MMHVITHPSLEQAAALLLVFAVFYLSGALLFAGHLLSIMRRSPQNPYTSRSWGRASASLLCVLWPVVLPAYLFLLGLFLIIYVISRGLPK